ncbi:unnamed protein product [Mytilus coruscus]|uniref:Death domain-containing protein n=1 Tax=Mytilus coruscus TaxID=42192 RepID=A0A6J8BKE5_MYTCO|nr:unnamed protein product [Mytilus coruscus]
MRIQETFIRMSKRGTIRREDLYLIWKQKDFCAILPYKEFIFNILIHLDILAEQRRYDTATGSRLPVDNFFVPCMVTERNTTSFMDKECTPKRAICLAFLFKGTIIPPALPNRLISACLSMWTVKQFEGRKLLFSGFIGLSFDKSHDIVVCVEGNKILLYVVHRTSSGLIVPDIATGVKECLVSTMERISDFYHSTIHAKSSEQSPFLIEYSCSKMQCFISEKKALQTNEWVCDKHNLTHRDGDWLVWNQDKKKEQCEPNCPGLSEDALNKIPSDIELLRFSTNFKLDQINELVSYLNLSKKWDEIKCNNPNNIAAANFLVLSKWKERKMKFKDLEEALIKMKISTHDLCQVRRVRAAETDIQADYLDFIPTDEILDKLAPQIGQVFFQLGAELELSIATLENIQSDKTGNLVAQNREVLFTWKEDRTVKPTLMVLVQALVNIGRGVLCLEEVMENININTLIASQAEREKHDKGAIPEKKTTMNMMKGQKDSMKEAVHHKLDFSDILDQMMSFLVISVDDRRTIEQNNDQENTLLDIVMKRGNPNKSVCIEVLTQNSGYEDLAGKLSDSSSSVSPPTKTGKICMCHHKTDRGDPWCAFDLFIKIRYSYNRASHCIIVPYAITCRANHDLKVCHSVRPCHSYSHHFVAKIAFFVVPT